MIPSPSKPAALDWKSVYAALHRDGAAAYPPAALHYVLQSIRNRIAQQANNQIPVHKPETPPSKTPLTPAEIITNFRSSAKKDFGPLTLNVLEDWNLQGPEELGRAVLLLAEYGCLTLEPGDRLEAFLEDPRPFEKD